jgi:ferredoxin-nitrite reductase
MFPPRTLVVAGTGPAGARLVAEVLARDPGRFQIRMFGAEPPPQAAAWYEQHGVFVHRGVRAEAIDRLRRVVTGGGGKVAEPYDLLVLPEDEVNGLAKEAAGDPAVYAVRHDTALQLAEVLAGTPAPPLPKPGNKNKIEEIKRQKDGLDAWPDVLRLAPADNWQELTEADKTRAKWHGLFFRTPTPGNFMYRLRLEGGRTNARQLLTIADLSDQYGKGFCDLTTRQQIQLRWFTLADVPEVTRRLAEVGLHGLQTGMDNVRGVCGCPLAGRTPHELLDATPVIAEFNQLLVGNRAFTNLPRKFNVTITGCLENCSHPETQDLALVPAYRELDGQQVNGFNVLVGGKQGSGGYTPAVPLDVFSLPVDAARLSAEVVLLFRDHGPRDSRVRARLAFLLRERGVGWFREELERRWGRPLLAAGADMRKKQHVDHLGIHPQKGGLYAVGMLVPVGRITTAQLRGVADLAERYGSGEVRVTTGQNLVVLDVPEARLGALTEEPIVAELPYDPSPIMRGLVACTGTDYCGLALIETKGYAVQVARELERRTAGRKIQPLTIHWSGCPAGCGLHQVATIGLQGCRSRVDGQVVDSAHVFVKGASGPEAGVGTDLMYDVPCDRLADALEPLVRYLPRS